MTRSGIKAALVIILLAGLVIAGIFLFRGRGAEVTRAIERPIERLAAGDDKAGPEEMLSRSIELAPHLITIRYQTSVFSCLDKEYDRLPWGIWRGEARMCWALEADVTAGFRTADLGVEKKDTGAFVIKTEEPKILGVDNRSTKLIYSRAGERFDWTERDIFPELNAALKMEAQKLGILDDAKKSLDYLAESLSVKYGTTVEVEYVPAR